MSSCERGSALCAQKANRIKANRPAAERKREAKCECGLSVFHRTVFDCVPSGRQA